MLLLFQFTFMNNLLGKSCCNLEECITELLNIRFVGLELLLQHLGRHLYDQKLLAVEIVAVLHLWLRVYFKTV